MDASAPAHHPTRRAGRAARVIRRAATCALVGLLALAPIPVGCQDQFWWALLGIGVLTAGAALAVALAIAPRAVQRPALPIVLAALGFYLIVQLVPLPAGVVAVLSPRRAELARTVAAALGVAAPPYLALTSSSKQTRDALLLYAACLAAFGTGALAFRRRAVREALFAAIGVAGAAMAVWGLVTMLREGGLVRMHSTFTNANRFAAFEGMGLLAAIGWRLLAERASHHARARAATAAAVACGLAFVATLSRMGIASLSLAVLLLAYVSIRRREASARETDPRSRRLLVIGASVAVSSILASALVSFDPVWQRYSVLFDGQIEGNGRLTCWTMAAGIVRDFPLFGSGAGSFQHVFPLYQLPGALSGFWKYAHNDYLNGLTDLGLVGAALVVAAMILWYRSVWGALSRSSSGARVAAWVGVGCVTYVALHSAADFVLKQPANAMLFAAIAGAAYGVARRPVGVAPTHARWPFVAAALAAVVAAALAVPLARAGLVLPLPETSGAAGPALDAARNALGHDPRDTDLRRFVARAVAAGGERLPAENAADARREALAILADGPRADMIDARALYLAALLRWTLGDVSRADDAMRAATSLARAYPGITRAAGAYFVRRFAEARGQDPVPLDDAVRALSMANAVDSGPGALRADIALLESVGASHRLGEIAPDVEWAARLLAEHHAACGNVDDARAVLEAYARAHGAGVGPEFLAALADAREQTGDVAGALAARVEYVTRSSVELRSERAASLVRTLCGRHRSADASMLVRALARSLPDTPAAARAEAEFALASRDYARAYRLLKQSTQGGGAEEHFALAAVALKLRRDAEAEVHLTHAIEASPSVARYWVERASVRARAGQTTLAIQDLHSALRASPTDDVVRMRLDGLLRSEKRIEPLVALWRESVEARPANALVREHYARALFTACDFDAAVAQAREAYALDPARASTRQLLREIDPDGPISRDAGN